LCSDDRKVVLRKWKKSELINKIVECEEYILLVREVMEDLDNVVEEHEPDYGPEQRKFERVDYGDDDEDM
jgi:hypothetical protein